DTALARARAFAKADPDNNLYDLISAELYERAGRNAEAIALLEKAGAARPSDGLTIALARLYSRTGDFPKAEVLLASRLKTDPKNVAIEATVASIYQAAGRIDDAKKVYDGLLSQQPDNVAGPLGSAEIAVAEKNWSAVTDYIDRARAAAPNDPAPGIAMVN